MENLRFSTLISETVWDRLVVTGDHQYEVTGAQSNCVTFGDFERSWKAGLDWPSFVVDLPTYARIASVW